METGLALGTWVWGIHGPGLGVFRSPLHLRDSDGARTLTPTQRALRSAFGTIGWLGYRWRRDLAASISRREAATAGWTLAWMKSSGACYRQLSNCRLPPDWPIRASIAGCRILGPHPGEPERRTSAGNPAGSSSGFMTNLGPPAVLSSSGYPNKYSCAAGPAPLHCLCQVGGPAGTTQPWAHAADVPTPPPQATSSKNRRDRYSPSTLSLLRSTATPNLEATRGPVKQPLFRDHRNIWSSRVNFAAATAPTFCSHLFSDIFSLNPWSRLGLPAKLYAISWL